MDRSYSLRRNKEFRYVYNRGKSIATKSVAMVYCKKKTTGLKIGFSVSKKIGNSVNRNKARRRLRECVRLNLPLIDQKCLLIYVARAPILQTPFEQLMEEVKYLIQKAVPVQGENN